MANIDELIKLIQQRAFLEAGGGRSNPAEAVGKIVTGLKGGMDYLTEQRAKNLAARKARLEMTPIGEFFGVPTAEQEAAMQAVFQEREAEKQEEDRNRIRMLFSGAEGPITREGMPPLVSGMQGPLTQAQEGLVPAQAQFEGPRKAFETDTGLSLDTPAFLAKEIAQAKALGGGTLTVYYNPVDGTTSFMPLPGYIPLSKVSSKKGAEFAVGKEKAKIVAGGAEIRQEKRFGQQERMEKNKEERQAARDAEKMSTDQEKAVKNLESVKSFVDEYFKELDRLVPPTDKASEIIKTAGKVVVSKIPVAGTISAPEITAFGKFREASKPKIARALGDVGNLSLPEQETAINLLSTPISSKAERDQAKRMIEEILVTSEMRSQEAVSSEKIKRAKGYLSREKISGGQETKSRKYASPLEVKVAVVKGKITKDEAEDILVEDFGYPR